MKSKKFPKKLVLNKSTITNLNSRALGAAEGGKPPTVTIGGITCGTLCNTELSCIVTLCPTDVHTCPATWCDTECGC
jgi:hypothetical protein